ncbi:MAG: FAD-dependent oxidoreductase [Candidatus Aenigmarchaeota archaeon]|nr:FAD-dependent oxidoreductase [Candidatus Aenigmarchaeota archaeon]
MESSSSPWIPTAKSIGYPSLSSDISADVCVVGGGIAGVFTAYTLAKKGFSVVLLEKKEIASGDTSYSTGFLTRVPDTNISALEKKYGKAFLRRLFFCTARAQEVFIETIKKENIECDFSPCKLYYCSYSKTDSFLKKEWETVREADTSAKLVSEDIGKIKQAIVFPNEGRFNPRKFVLSLVQRAKIQVFENSEVLSFEDIGHTVILKTASGRVKAKKVIFTTGSPPAFIGNFSHIIEPKITFAITAKYKNLTIPDNTFADTFRPYYYYRKIDDKTLMLGGADRAVGVKTEGDPHETLKQFLEDYLPGEFEIQKKWSGSLFETADGLPYISAHPAFKDRIFLVTGFGGNGLVFSAVAANLLSDLVSGKNNEYTDIFSFARAGSKLPEIPKAQVVHGFTKVATTKDVVEGKPFCASAGGRKIALFNVSGKIYAIDNMCTHAGGPLSEGEIKGQIVQCPYHGAKFDVTTGKVLGPPATMPVKAYETRVSGENIEINLSGKADQEKQSPEAEQHSLGKEIWGKKAYIAKTAALLILFWAVQFVYQYFSFSNGSLSLSLVRASSFSGATLIGIAIMLGPLSLLKPKYNFVEYRRTFGVGGFTIIILHALSAIAYVYGFDFAALFFSLNPFANAVLFGVFAFAIFLPLYSTSTDWAVRKLGFARWKAIHRLIYVGYIFSILHYTRMNPPALFTPPGYLLISVTVLVIALQLAGFVTKIRRGESGKGKYIGAAIISFGAILFLLAFFFKGIIA